MKRLPNIILTRFISLSLIAFIVVVAISYYYLKNNYIEQTKEELNKFLNITIYEIKHKLPLNDVALKIKQSADIRVTIIQDSGKVLADSDSNASKMDNHKYRDEIIKARNIGIGFKVRYSKTLNKELCYLAKKISINGKTLFVRVAKPLSNINKALFRFLSEIGIIFLLFLIIVSYVVYRISKNIGVETDKILSFLKELVKQKNSMSISSDYSYEFYNITKLLSKTSKELRKRDKRKSKYTARLKLANKQKDEIISAISHEFKNPITVIDGYAQTLIEDKEINPRIRNRFLEKIHTNTNKLNDLIDRLRLFTKLEDYKQPLTFSEQNLNDLAKEAIEDVQSAYTNREVKLEAKQVVTKLVDKELFVMAVKNLIENAIKYSEDEVVVFLDETQLCVKDKGIGIPQKDIEKITKKFYRVSKHSWNNSLGIGLSIVNRVLKLHNFSLEISSKEFEGSSFCVRFGV